MSDLLKLIERLEQAEKGSRELDAWVAAVTNTPGWKISEVDGMPLRCGPDFADLSYYTTSLDAALTLLPDDPTNEITSKADWQLESTNGGLTISARVGADEKRTFAYTPTLALCAAALKARAASKG